VVWRKFKQPNLVENYSAVGSQELPQKALQTLWQATQKPLRKGIPRV
jgi:hypothetical protein